MEVIQQGLSQSAFKVDHLTHAAEVRRFAMRIAEEMEMCESDRGAVGIAVTEMATNIVKHAKSGQMVVSRIGNNGHQGLRVLALDQGPGILDLTTALQDGYSTAGTSGTGLGAVRRMASRFDMYSVPDRGTSVLAEFWPRKKPTADTGLDIGVVSVAFPGEPVSGDGWAVITKLNRVRLMVVDGLGHGEFASEAAREAERVFAEHHSDSPTAILQDCHDALKKTRGAAMAIALIDRDAKTLTFAGLGNISGSIVNQGHSKGLASHNGILGHQMHRIQEFNFPWKDDTVLIMHSDGLSTRWNLNEFRGLGSRKSALIASVLYRDFAKHRDDMTVLVAKNS